MPKSATTGSPKRVPRFDLRDPSRGLHVGVPRRLATVPGWNRVLAETWYTPVHTQAAGRADAIGASEAQGGSDLGEVRRHPNKTVTTGYPTGISPPETRPGLVQWLGSTFWVVHASRPRAGQRVPPSSKE